MTRILTELDPLGSIEIPPTCTVIAPAIPHALDRDLIRACQTAEWGSLSATFNIGIR